MLPMLLREMCQFVEEPIVGVEGEVPSEMGTLRGVVIVFRHGDSPKMLSSCRSPLHGEVDTAGSCSPFRDIDRRSFADYQRLVQSPHFKHFVKLEEPMDKFERAPSASRCALGEMTAEGALQHLKFGSFLHRQYTRNGWLTQSEHKWDLQFASTPYVRTFQSALAFIASFIYPLHKLFGRIRLGVSNMTHFCMDEKCHCENVLDLHRTYEEERTRFFESYFGLRTASRVRSLMSVYGIDISDPLHFVDISLGRYICRRMPLPCRGDVCIGYDDVVQMANIVSERDSAMFNSSSKSSGSVLRRLAVAESAAILQSVSHVIQTLHRNRSRNVLRVYSGHDVTLRPLLFALGLPHREPSHYISRLVFEIYEKKVVSASTTDVNLFLRILHNGIDRTHDLTFCRKFTFLSSNLCPVATFQRFVDEDLFRIAHTKSLNELCSQKVLKRFDSVVN
ncbi:unnamed protein product [Toxocara canis]|uniref:2-phosphoxylose phosphatase 1 n=1 Tax=Toxocara canis TaxID=6265 RepID=A0A183URX9_TOXCA|nr:unnamed protein product [Toxocara canis]